MSDTRKKAAPKKPHQRPNWYMSGQPKRDTAGWSYWFWYSLWWLYGAMRLYDRSWMPIPYLWGGYYRGHRGLGQLIRDMKFELQGMISVVSYKGGVGKSTHSAWITAMFSLFSRNQTLCIDTDSGGRGDVARLFGIDIEHMKYTLNGMQEMIVSGDWEPRYNDLTRALPRHEQSNAMVLAPNAPIETKPLHMEKFLRALDRNVPLCVIDTTPGIKERNNDTVRKVSTVSVLSALDQESSLFDMMRYREDHREDFDRGLRDGTQLIVIGDVQWHHFNQRHRYQWAKDLDVPVDRLFLLPRCKHVQGRRPVDTTRVSRRFLYAVTRLTYAAAVAVVGYNRAHPTGDLQLESEKSVREIAAKAEQVIAVIGVEKAHQLADRVARKQDVTGVRARR